MDLGLTSHTGVTYEPEEWDSGGRKGVDRKLPGRGWGGGGIEEQGAKGKEALTGTKHLGIWERECGRRCLAKRGFQDERAMGSCPHGESTTIGSTKVQKHCPLFPLNCNLCGKRHFSVSPKHLQDHCLMLTSQVGKEPGHVHFVTGAKNWLLVSP